MKASSVLYILALSSGVSAFAPAASSSSQRGGGGLSYISASPLEEVDNAAPLDPFDAFGPGADDIAIRETVVGNGETVREGDVVTVKYEGRLYESQLRFGAVDALPVKIGNGGLVKGFEQALNGKKVGSQFTVRIPSMLAWGNRGKESQQTGRIVVPPGSDIEFDVEVIGVAQGFMGEIELFGKDRAIGITFCALLAACAGPIESVVDTYLR